VTAVSTDARIGFAHAAVIALAAASLAAEGYRAGRERHHERLIDSLRYTVGAESQVLKGLHDIRRARHAVTYEQVRDASTEEVEEIIRRARQVRRAVATWLRRRHPDLLTMRERR
jgi:HEPN domain